ncbi:beta-galactosidase [Actinotalea sp. BY-33]|uniref:Beta-galactosidase n=1 Tax=Actinotalea soli TaxID=2819234 RepID=A0A939LV65_9CELL|nr:beta-galactosidase family protein [Actinotalea soli]MBO1752704.1 beta-galactosidase [Actinotalea soli]
MPTFEIGEHDFLLDGEPRQVLSGALHYFRVHPDLWADRIRKARLMGLNTIETYVAWNFHAPERGVFDTTGPRDLGRFLDLVAAEGMHAIVRPGPYICAEWDNGGLPAWLFAEEGVGIRRHEPTYMAAVAEYYAALMPIVAPRQVADGGPVILVQVENEYGAYGDDKDYLRALVDLTREHGITVPLITCDQANDGMLERGGLPELHRTATFGSRSPERLATLRRHQPTGPLMCMEYWNGWFDSWGLPHHVAAPEANATDLDALLSTGASVNLYMFHGGTNLGLTNGANDKGWFLPITTSYDYDAPLAEHGAVTPKYHAMREALGRHAPVPEDLPAASPAGPVLEVALDRQVPLSGLLPERLAGWDHLPTTDEMGQWSGFTVYRTRVEAEDRVLTVAEVRDRALVLHDGEVVGLLSRRDGVRSVPLPPRAGELTLVLENEGRVNYGPRLGEAKGLIGPARTATRELTGWQAGALPLDAEDLVSHLAGAVAVDPEAPVPGPVLRAGSFVSLAGRDHFLRLDGFTKGLVWVNGTLLGRYSAAGPTRTLYVPGPVVRVQNELVVLELHAASTGTARFVEAPDLGPVDV